MVRRKNRIKLNRRYGLGKFVSPLSDRGIPPLDWYGFKHRFGSKLVSKMFSMFDLSKGATILDPFCGGGTTLIKAKMEGYSSVGIDILPTAVFVSNALTKSYNERKLKTAFCRIKHDIDYSVRIPDVGILKISFTENALKYIFSLRNVISSLKPHERTFFLLVLLCILEEMSKAKKSGGFLRISNQRRRTAQSVKACFIETADRFIQEIDQIRYTNQLTKAYLGDARNYPK